MNDLLKSLSRFISTTASGLTVLVRHVKGWIWSFSRYFQYFYTFMKQ